MRERRPGLIQTSDELAALRAIADEVASRWPSSAAPPEVASRIVRAVCRTRRGASAIEAMRSCLAELGFERTSRDVVERLHAGGLLAADGPRPFRKRWMLRSRTGESTTFVGPDADVVLDPTLTSALDALPDTVEVDAAPGAVFGEDPIALLLRRGVLVASSVEPHGIAFVEPRPVLYLEMDSCASLASSADYVAWRDAIDDAAAGSLFRPVVRLVAPVPVTPLDELTLFETVVRLINDEVDEVSVVLRLDAPPGDWAMGMFTPRIEAVTGHPLTFVLDAPAVSGTSLAAAGPLAQGRSADEPGALLVRGALDPSTGVQEALAAMGPAVQLLETSTRLVDALPLARGAWRWCVGRSLASAVLCGARAHVEQVWTGRAGRFHEGPPTDDDASAWFALDLPAVADSGRLTARRRTSPF